MTLEGLAFYEFGTKNGKGVIRCHGAQSIRKALDQLPHY